MYFKRLFYVLAILLTLIVAGCFGDSEEISIVKNGHFNGHPQKTVGEAVDNFFANPKWESGVGSDGETKGKTLVNATGKITYMDKEVKAEIQFIVNKDNGTFNMNAFEMNGIPQNVFMVAGLINKMF